jgi:hypothetical protein
MFDKWSAEGRTELVIDLDRTDALADLRHFYGAAAPRVLEEVLGHAYRLGAHTAVVEPRYVDADYRNEHSRFYSTTFRRYPSVAHRMHFFGDTTASLTAGEAKPFRFRNRDYVGYTVLRPVPAAPVGRTMLRTSPVVERQTIACLARDTVNLFGSDLAVVGVPFYAQDAQLSRCGQATMLTTAYYHHLAFGQPRFLPGDLADAITGSGGELGRLLPSPGLNIDQLVDAASAIGLPPVVYPLERFEAGGLDVEATICRYLNSRLPVTVATHDHAFLIVGYERSRRGDGSSHVRFLRQDDETGPYQWVDQWRLDETYGRWQYVIAPLPPKVYLKGEEAEEIGKRTVLNTLRASGDAKDLALLARLDDPARPLSWRSAVIPSNEFKRSVSARGLRDDLAAAYQFAHLSRYVWVVELTDRVLRDERQPCVFAEAVIDATDHERDPRPLAWRLPSGFGMYLPDIDKTVPGPRPGMTEPIRSVIETFQPHVLRTP